jgi:hypothetical protein
LFDSDGRLVGALSAGASTCSDPRRDWYYSFHEAWHPSDSANLQLKCWLDPVNSAQTSLDGFDPYAASRSLRLSNILKQHLNDSVEINFTRRDTTAFDRISNMRKCEYAEEYYIADKAKIEGVYIVADDASEPDAELSITAVVYDSNRNKICEEKFSPSFTEWQNSDSSFVQSPKVIRERQQETFVKFTNPVTLSGRFYVGYTIAVSSDLSRFAVYSLKKGATNQNTAWILENGKWIGATQYTEAGFPSSLFIDPVIRYTEGVSSEQIIKQNAQSVRISKADNGLFVSFAKPVNANVEFALYSAEGKLLMKRIINGYDQFLSLPAVGRAVIATVRINDELYSQKLMY